MALVAGIQAQAMTDEEQYNSTIHIANSKGELKGCGFLVDSGHVMTCAHVVEFCRLSEVAAAPDPTGFRVFGHKNGAVFRLRLVANRDDLTDPDVAILALDEGERFHEGFAVVRWEPCRTGLGFRGSGLITAENAAGVPAIIAVDFDGKVRGLTDPPTRYLVHSTQDDARLDAGCSGGAVFADSAERGLIGMVVEYQQLLSGKIVHAQALRDCWPALERCRTNADPGPGASAGAVAGAFIDIGTRTRLNLPDLDDSIARCDREAQTDPFRDRVRLLDKARRGALLTTIHGQPLDLPDRLSDRLCDLGPRALMRRKLPDTTKRLPRPNIDMAKCAANDEAGMRARVEYRLQDTLRSDRPEIKSFVTAIRKLGHPLMIEVRASEAFIAEQGKRAAAVWIGLAAELAEHDLGAPLFVFFLVIRSGDPAGAAAMAGWSAEDERFLVLDELGPVGIDDIGAWAETCYGGAVAEEVADLVAARSGGAGTVRLKQLQDWLTGG